MLYVRFLKFACVFLFAAGTLAAVMPKVEFETRKRFVFWLAAPGFGGAWAMGFLLVALTRQTVLSLWILLSLALSFLTINALLFIAGREGRYGPTPAALAILALLGTLAMMVWRPVWGS